MGGGRLPFGAIVVWPPSFTPCAGGSRVEAPRDVGGGARAKPAQAMLCGYGRCPVLLVVRLGIVLPLLGSHATSPERSALLRGWPLSKAFPT